MEKFNLGIYILAGIALIGMIVLITLDKTTDVIVPILTALIGILAGKNQSAIGAIFGKKK